jgi:hypothetical protein
VRKENGEAYADSLSKTISIFINMNIILVATVL